MSKIFLLADDDGDDRELFCEALQEVDPLAVCEYVENGKAALDLLAQKSPTNYPNLIFLDINMPILNGWDLLVELKKSEALKHIPVLMFSTTSHYREINTALELGAMCIFTKPPSYTGLKNILQVVVQYEGAQLLQALRNYNDTQPTKVFTCAGDDNK